MWRQHAISGEYTGRCQSRYTVMKNENTYRTVLTAKQKVIKRKICISFEKMWLKTSKICKWVQLIWCATRFTDVILLNTYFCSPCITAISALQSYCGLFTSSCSQLRFRSSSHVWQHSNSTEALGMLREMYELGCMRPCHVHVRVFEWHKWFKEEYEDVKNNLRSGRSSTSGTEDNVDGEKQMART